MNSLIKVIAQGTMSIHKVYRGKERQVLIKDYINQGYSLQAIANQFDVPLRTIKRWMK